MSYFEDIAEYIKNTVDTVAPKQPEQPSEPEKPATKSSSTATTSLSVDPSNAQALAEIYKVLAPMSTDYANAQAEQIGQAQRSMGTLAGRTMGGSQTAGLGNYTYNRLIRPQVDTMRDELLVKGYTAQLNRLLSDTLSQAKSNYRKKSSSSSSNKSSTGDFTVETEVTDEAEPQKLYLTPSEAYNITSSLSAPASKYVLEQLSGRPMTESNYNTYKEMWEKYKK